MISLLTRCALNIRQLNECFRIVNDDLVLNYKALINEQTATDNSLIS